MLPGKPLPGVEADAAERIKDAIRFFLSFLLLCAGLAFAQDRPQSDAQREDAEQLRLLEQGAMLLRSRKPEAAISEYFGKVISFYEAKYKDTPEQIYCARNVVETIFYLTKHANQNPNKNAIVVRVWCDAHFLKAYALVELGRMADAKSSLEAAISLAPANSQYLSELGHIYQVEKSWTKALENYRAAEEAAQFSDAQVKNSHLTRAHRGVGYVLIELDRLDEAELKYKQSLEIDKNDPVARNQLEYIHQLRAKRARPSP